MLLTRPWGRRIGMVLALCWGAALWGAGSERPADQKDAGQATAPEAPAPNTPPAATEAPGPIAPTVYLHAAVATVHGKRLKYEKGGAKDNLGFWTDKNDWASWDFTVSTPDTMDVLITYACPRGNASDQYSLAVTRKLPDGKPAATKGAKPAPTEAGKRPFGTQEIVATVPDTGSWDKYVTDTIGQVVFSAPGEYSVAVKAKQMTRGALMNLRAITFRSSRWDTSLVAWWQFDEGSGTTTVGGAGGGTDVVQFAHWVPGSVNSGLRFRGFSGAVVRPADRAPRLREALTLEAWVRVDSQQEAWLPIANQMRYPTGYFFGLDGAGDLGLHLGVGGRWLACTSWKKVPVGAWTHVAATFSQGFGIAVYVDGALTGHLPATGLLTPAADEDLLIGQHSHHPWRFHGVLDEIKIYNRALAAREVHQHYEWTRPTIVPTPRIRLAAVRPDRVEPAVFERLTLDLDLKAAYYNPFDAEEIRVDAEVVTPSGKTWTAPGFCHQPYRRRNEAGVEILEADGKPRWQVRLSFAEPGEHWVQVSASDRTGTTIAAPLVITARAADVPGRVRRHPTDHRYFVTDRGESFFPLGANVCWADKNRATYDYDAWLAQYARSGCNFFRVWLSPHWPTLALNTLVSGFDHVDLHRAARLDHVVETAERLGLTVMFCIDSFNILRTKLSSPGVWEDAPFIRARGGPLDKPEQYFTDPWSRHAYRNRLRYLVARWGYSPALFAWEFWNEVDLIDEYPTYVESVRDWHLEMARALRDLDPWDHLVTTSFCKIPGEPSIDSLPEFDFVMTHSYSSKDLVADFAKHIKDKKAARDRPHFHGEIGIGHSGEDTAKSDPTGVHLHNAVFASLGQGHAGAPMTWWWDSYVHPQKLYRIFASFARWIEGFDFVGQQPKPVEYELAGNQLNVLDPTVVEPVAGSWDPAPYNKPIAVTVDKNGTLTHAVPISDVLHGLGFHKKLHNPVTFALDVPKPTTFAVVVTKTSGYADANLRILLDNKPALERKFPIPEGNKDTTLVVHAGRYEIKLPAGRHTVKVENTGTDWAGVGAYHIPWVKTVRLVSAPLRVYGLTGRTMALIWIQNKLHTWPEATKQGFKPRPVTGAALTIKRLAPGTWTVEHWATRAGKVAKAETRTVAANGILTVPLPAIPWDAALRLRKTTEKAQTTLPAPKGEARGEGD